MAFHGVVKEWICHIDLQVRPLSKSANGGFHFQDDRLPGLNASTEDGSGDRDVLWRAGRVTPFESRITRSSWNQWWKQWWNQWRLHSISRNLSKPRLWTWKAWEVRRSASSGSGYLICPIIPLLWLISPGNHANTAWQCCRLPQPLQIPRALLRIFSSKKFVSPQGLCGNTTLKEKRCKRKCSCTVWLKLFNPDFGIIFKAGPLNAMW